MFPIMTVNGKVVAFGGRRLDNNEKMAKYINSNENLIYSKKKHLFALNIARQTNDKRLILVEGYKNSNLRKIEVYRRLGTLILSAIFTLILMRYELIVIEFILLGLSIIEIFINKRLCSKLAKYGSSDR